MAVTECMMSENGRLQRRLEEALEEIETTKEALHGFRKDMIILSQELTKIRTLEMQIERTFHSLAKKRAHLEEMFIKAVHCFDELMR